MLSPLTDGAYSRIVLCVLYVQSRDTNARIRMQKKTFAQNSAVVGQIATWFLVIKASSHAAPRQPFWRCAAPLSMRWPSGVHFLTEFSVEGLARAQFGGLSFKELPRAAKPHVCPPYSRTLAGASAVAVTGWVGPTDGWVGPTVLARSPAIAAEPPVAIASDVDRALLVWLAVFVLFASTLADAMTPSSELESADAKERIRW